VVKMASAAIFTVHHIYGFNSGITDHPFVVNVRHCAQRLLGARSLRNRKAPTPIELCLSTSQQLLQHQGFFYLQLATYIMFCFAGFFRFSDAAGIRTRDVSFEPGYIVMKLRTRKNDQFRQGSLVHVAEGRSAAWPVRLTRQLIAAGTGQGPWLFKHMQGLNKRDRSQVQLDGSRQLDYGQIKRQALQALASTANMSVAQCSKLFGTQSFRRGGCYTGVCRGR
jgi:integrase